MTSGSRAGGQGTASGSSGAGDRLEREPIGRYLRKQRELRGISAEELAALTRIPLRSLMRLEAGHFDDDIDGFVRGFVRTVALGLGLDPDETMSRMLNEPRPEDLMDPHFSRSLPRALVGLSVLVLLVALVGLVRFVVNREPTSRSDVLSEETLYRRDPVRALAESDAASRAGQPAQPAAARRKPRPANPASKSAPPANASPAPTEFAADVAAPPPHR